MMSTETGKIVVDSLTFPDAQGSEAYSHDQIVYCDDTPDSKVQMNVWRRELGIHVHAARKSRMRRLSFEWLAGLREIVIDPERYAMMDDVLRGKEMPSLIVLLAILELMLLACALVTLALSPLSAPKRLRAGAGRSDRPRR